MSRALKSNFLVNFAGAIVGTVVTLVTVPHYIAHIGEARYGILSLIWILLGYLGVLDFGLSRATAATLAKMSGASASERSSVFATALLTNLALGIVGAGVIYFAGGYMIGQTRGLTPELSSEVEDAMLYVAPMLCLALVSSVGIGALESKERFVLANSLQTTSNALTQIVPLIAVVILGPSLRVVAPAILIVRSATMLAVLGVVVVTEKFTHRMTFDRSRLRSLLGYGAWITVTNLISPIMTSVDQFVIANTIGANAVGRYSVSMSVASRLQLLSAVLSRTIFPRFARLDPEQAAKLAARAVVVLAYLSAMVFSGALVVSHRFFELWLGAEMAAHAAPIALIVIFSAWVNGLAFVPFSLLQSQGRPDLVAKLHAFEVVPYCVLLFVLIKLLGLPGAAMAWGARVVIDAIVLMRVARLPSRDLGRALPALVGTIGALVLGTTIGGLSLSIVLSVGTALALCIGCVGILVDPNIRALVGPAWRLVLRQERRPQ